MREIKTKLSWVILITLIMTIGMGGCRKDMAKQAKVNSESDTATKQIFENYGREIAVSAVPEKVLTLGPNCTELFCALGLADYVIGNSLNNHSRGPLEEYREIYETIPELNHQSATREAVLSSGADFIYGIDWEFGKEALDIEELQQYGITVYMNAAQNLEEIYQEILDIGSIFQTEERAEEFVSIQQQRIAKVEAVVKGAEPPRVLVYDSGNDGVFTCSGTSFESLLISVAGGTNIFEDQRDKQWITVSYEEVLKREPEIIVIHDYDSPSAEEKIAEIKANPILSELECVRNERFVMITLESVLPGVRMADTVEKMAEVFYPELF